jgi:tagatose-6-phosphate ketose/aldose isomerase
MQEVYLGLNKSSLIEAGGLITAKEIAGQPELWKKVYAEIVEKQELIKSFIHDHITSETKIILTGAGTSAFIGSALQGSFNRSFGTNSVAISTTDLITHPLDYLNPEKHHLLISFARSGDSPESVGVAQLVTQICPNTSHLIITCNKDGRLANLITGQSVLSIILPPESNDQGLAMTGSFTSMLLAGLLITKINKIVDLEESLNRLVSYGNLFLTKYLDVFTKLGDLDFDRALFLGSGPLLGCAIESHLKLQEMTDGIVLCKFDSYLGLRHGPKVIINPKTLVVNLLSNNKDVQKYEIDLLKDISRLPSKAFVTISEYDTVSDIIQGGISLTENQENLIDEDFLPVCFVLPAQLIGFFKSINLNLQPDCPSVNGTISRVVTGVTIYPFKYLTKEILTC